MAKGHRSQIKRERNANKDNRPSAKLSYARVSVQKACYVLDAIRGKDVESALGILTYNPRYASSVVKKLLESASGKRREQQRSVQREPVCGGVLRQQGADHEEDPAPCAGPCLPDRKKNKSYLYRTG